MDKKLSVILFLALAVIFAACSASSVNPASTLPPTLLVPAATALPSPTPIAVPPSPTVKPSATPKPTPPSGQLLVVTLPAPSLKDNLLGDPAENAVTIYLPPSYATSNQRYPVVYFLVGYGDFPNDYVRGAIQGFNLQKTMDQFIAEKKIGEMIIVMPNGQHRLGGSFYVNSPVTGNWEDFIVKDLVTYVDANYRSLSVAASRGIAGHSMGGYGALHLAMLHPDVFSAVYSLSPGLFEPDGVATSQMFETQKIIDAYLALENRLAGMSREAARAELLKLTDDQNLFFTMTYGMAFAPDPQKNAPYIDYPYRLVDGKPVRDDATWALWQGGFGGIAEGIPQYKDNFLKLKGIGIDYGLYDSYAWIVKGCEYLDQQLTAAGIPHRVETFNGGHSNFLRDRIEQFMLPFFSETLAR